MPAQFARYIAPAPVVTAPGWHCERLTPPSRLYGANGMRIGPDGRIYVAQVSGSQISAVDPGTGAVEAFSPMGGDIVGPDDLAFDDRGNLYATEITEGRVCMRTPDGKVRVLQGDMPCANPITVHQGRLFAGECRPDGRIMELSLDGGAPRIILDRVPMPNAMEVGPDGKLYIPIMGTNEIWRVDLAGGEPEKVAGELGVPDAVKFDAAGQIVSTQVASGQVLRINPANGERSVLATVAPGLDNLVFLGERLFVSSISGQINEILAGGKLRSLVPDGLNWPLDLVALADGVLFVADGPFVYALRAGGARQVVWMLFSPGSPGYTRGLCSAGPGEFIATTAKGEVARCRPAEQHAEFLAQGLDRLYGVDTLPGGAVVVAEAGAGRLLRIRAGEVEVLAGGLSEPMGVAVTGDGRCLVAEAGAGRVVAARGGRTDIVLDSLQKPHGIAVHDDTLYVVDAGTRELTALELASGRRRVIAHGLPVGAPPGVEPKFLRAIGVLSGPMGPFSGVAAAPDGTLYVSADAEGSVLVLRPDPRDLTEQHC